MSLGQFQYRPVFLGMQSEFNSGYLGIIGAVFRPQLELHFPSVLFLVFAVAKISGKIRKRFAQIYGMGRCSFLWDFPVFFAMQQERFRVFVWILVSFIL